MTAKVDFPLPRMPIRTIEASGSNMRGYSVGRKAGTGVVLAALLPLGIHVGLCLRDAPLKRDESGPWKACAGERPFACIAAKDRFLPTVPVAMVKLNNC
jgi:hypothetical protein